MSLTELTNQRQWRRTGKAVPTFSYFARTLMIKHTLKYMLQKLFKYLSFKTHI